MLDEFGIEERETKKLVLIQIHHEELVGRGQVQLLGRELLVEVADVLAVFLLARRIRNMKKTHPERTRNGRNNQDCKVHRPISDGDVIKKREKENKDKENELDSDVIGVSYFSQAHWRNVFSLSKEFITQLAKFFG